MLDTASRIVLRIVVIMAIAYVGGAVHKMLRHPEILGQWQARKDIAYDSVWSEYLFDTQPQE